MPKEQSTSSSFPRNFRHKLCSLRPELIESFVDAKYIQFVKFAATQIQQMNAKKEAAAATESSTELEDAKQLVKQLSSLEEDAANSQILQRACKHVGSYKEAEFDIRFNPNLFQPVVQLADAPDVLECDKKMLNEACEYLVVTQVPSLVREMLEHAVFVTDGVTLCETMHTRGINLRYLGYVLEQLSRHETLSYVYSVGVCELVSRCAKRVFRQYVQTVSGLSLSAAVAHFLNCYLSMAFKSSGGSSSPVASATSSTSGSAPANSSTGVVEATTSSEQTVAGKAATKKNRKKNQKKNNRNSLQGRKCFFFKYFSRC